MRTNLTTTQILKTALLLATASQARADDDSNIESIRQQRQVYAMNGHNNYPMTARDSKGRRTKMHYGGK